VSAGRGGIPDYVLDALIKLADEVRDCTADDVVRGHDPRLIRRDYYKPAERAILRALREARAQ